MTTWTQRTKPEGQKLWSAGLDLWLANRMVWKIADDQPVWTDRDGNWVVDTY